jgi:three-Cys-motif partner protein
MLEFHGDAICLSGIYGTAIKSEIIGQYYEFWWKITSGGNKRDFQNQTAIVELNAGSGEVFIKELDKTLLGSAGHSLVLKKKLDKHDSLKLVLIEEDAKCYSHLINVITRRIPGIPINICEGPVGSNSTNIFLMNLNLDTALNKIEEINLGNSIFFFDPLRMVKWEIIEKVGKGRIKNYYQTGTEFIIFLFTSDYFLGRDEFAAFPTTNDEQSWSGSEKRSITEADELFGNTTWRLKILCTDDILRRQNNFVDLYKENLQKWFRYVLPLPFKPKKGQLYHLIICSNYEAGIRETKSHYSQRMGNKKVNQDNTVAYSRFKNRHHDLCKDFTGTTKPLEWKILWAIIKQEIGIRDFMCSDIKRLEENRNRRQNAMMWLEQNSYLDPIKQPCAWNFSIQKYMLNWQYCKDTLGIELPSPLIPISPESATPSLSSFVPVKVQVKTGQFTFDQFI